MVMVMPLSPSFFYQGESALFAIMLLFLSLRVHPGLIFGEQPIFWYIYSLVYLWL